MAIVRILLLFIFSSSMAFASQVQKAFKAKDYRKVVALYEANKKRPFPEKDLVAISYSLRKDRDYREDVKVVYGIIKRFHNADHTRILKAIKTGETLDSDEVPHSLKLYYWILFNDYAFILKSYTGRSKALEADERHFRAFAKILSEVEFREGKVDRTVDKVAAHLQYLSDKIYHFKKSFSLQYVSWQQEAKLEGPDVSTDLIITNRGLCTGGDIGFENYLFHFYLDACFLYGAGGVNDSGETGADYQQSNLPAWGLKGGPGVSVIVSSSRSRIGLKVPVLYSVQNLTTPEADGYSVSGETEISYLTTLYSRWQFNKWYFQTEFGKYVQKEQSFWGLGIGREF